MTNSADPDQLASSEERQGISGFSRTRVKTYFWEKQGTYMYSKMSAAEIFTHHAKCLKETLINLHCTDETIYYFFLSFFLFFYCLEISEIS